MPSSSRHFAKHVRVSSTEDLSYAVPASGSGNGQTSEAIQTIVTGRKCWKTIKGKGEVVWPPYLEAALVEGLEKYTPVETRSSRALGRFPMRNKFISDYIFKVTGKRRTPKQVGSRLQQLRDTCEGKRILKLLSKRPGDLPKIEEDGASEDAEPSGPSTVQAPPQDFICLDVLLPDAPWSYSSADARYSLASDASPSTSKASPFPSPRPLRYIDPTVTFRSGSPVSAYSSFRVTKDGVLVHSEMTELEMRSSSCMPAPPASQWPSEMECTFLYSTTLVPHFWQQLCEAEDLGAYTIVQEIIRSNPASSEASSSDRSTSGDTMFSVVYQFNTNPSHSTPPQSPENVPADTISFTAESTPDVESDIEDMAMYNAFRDPALVAASPALSHTSHSSALQPTPTLSTTYDMPPDLIRDGEDGYASLPQSPLDATFPVLGSGIAAGAGADPNDSLCRSYVDVDYAVSFESLDVTAMSATGLPGVGPAGLIGAYSF